ncbi:MAG: DUF494 family protein [Bacteroidota bacterium]
MKEKVVELLVFIMTEIQENKRINEIDIADLRSKGYTQSEISAAFSWLYDNFQLNETAQRHEGRQQGSQRMLHEAEKYALTTESQGYLIQLRELGLLDERDLETVIERVMLTGYEKLSIAELHSIVAAVIFARGGDRLLLNTGDTIN